MLWHLKQFIRKKLHLRFRDILIFAVIFAVFFVSKDTLIKYYLRIVSAKYITLYKIENQPHDGQYAKLYAENQNLKRLLNLKAESKKKIIFGSVLSNIYANAFFWTWFENAAQIQIGSSVWSRDKELGARLIGFVAQKRDNFVLIKPITHKFVRFSAKTVEGVGLLLIGCRVVFSSNPTQPIKNGTQVFFDDLFVGIFENGMIYCKEFSKIMVVCINL